MATQFTKLSVSPEVVQTTGTSEKSVMSQNAVTNELTNLDTRVTTLENNQGTGGGSTGGSGVTLKSYTPTSVSDLYNKLNTLIDNNTFSHLMVRPSESIKGEGANLNRNEAERVDELKATTEIIVLSKYEVYRFTNAIKTSSKITLSANFTILNIDTTKVRGELIKTQFFTTPRIVISCARYDLTDTEFSTLNITLHYYE